MFSLSFRTPASHTMHLRISRPFPKRLAIKPENYPTQAPKSNQTHVRHNRRDKSILHRPRSNELGESIAPNVLVDSDGDENGPCDRFVGIDGICRGYSWEGGNLDSSASVADDYDDLFL